MTALITDQREPFVELWWFFKRVCDVIVSASGYRELRLDKERVSLDELVVAHLRTRNVFSWLISTGEDVVRDKNNTHRGYEYKE